MILKFCNDLLASNLGIYANDKNEIKSALNLKFICISFKETPSNHLILAYNHTVGPHLI